MGAVCAGLIGLYIGVAHIGAPVSVPIERMTLGPAVSGHDPITGVVPRVNPPAAAAKRAVKVPSPNRSIGATSDVHHSGGVTPAPVITTSTPTWTPTVTAQTVSLKTVSPKPVSAKPVAPKPVTKPVAEKPPAPKPPAPKPVVQPPAPKPVVQPPDEPVPPTVVPPTVVPQKDGVDEGHDGVDIGDVSAHESCDHSGDQKDDQGHDGYGSPDGPSHGDGEPESDGYDHAPTEQGNAPTAAVGVVSNTSVGLPEGG
jgi:hypothetical protein